MPGVDDFFAPIQYDWWWWAVLPVFVALLVAWILLSRRIAQRVGRRPSAVELPKPWIPPRDAAEVALEGIERVLTRARAGDLDRREAHVELSKIVREYGWKRTGVDARTMTLDELRRSRLTTVADVVATFYPIAFAPGSAGEAAPSAEIEPAAERARSVVTSWS